MEQISGVFSKLLWLLMAFHILFVGSEFPEVLEEKPVSGYTLSQTKLPASSFLKKIKALPGIPENMTQEETSEHPDYVPIGLKSRTELPEIVPAPSDSGIPFEEINRPQFHPNGYYLPPEVLHS